MRIVIEIDPAWLWREHESQGMNMEASEMRFGEIVAKRVETAYAHLMRGYMDGAVIDWELPRRVLAPIVEPIITIEGYDGDNLASIRSHVRDIARNVLTGAQWLVSREVSADPLLGGM